MKTVKCPHCKKEIELGEVAAAQAESLAAQKIKNIKIESDKKIKVLEKEKQDARKDAKEEAKKELEVKFKKDQKQKDEKIKSLEKEKQDARKEAKKEAKEEAKKELEKEKQDIRKDAKEEAKKELESKTAEINAKAENKIRRNNEIKEQEKNALKIQNERMRKDLEKMKQRAEQGSSADQGASQHNLLGDNLKEMFDKTEDEIRPYGTGEPGADWIQKIKKDDEVIGIILYESKKTQKFSKDWYGKLQDDMKVAKADVGIIFSTALPKDFDKKKGYIDKGNIYVCNYDLDKLKILAAFQRKLLIGLNALNINRGTENKISALEFLNKPEMKNLLGQLQSKLSGYSDIVVKGEKFTRDLKKNYLEFDGLFDELFILIQDFGLKREEKKNKITK